MNAFNLTVVIITIGIVVVACLSGICSLLLGKRDK
jgi:Na+-driven multidrug efflux pump